MTKVEKALMYLREARKILLSNQRWEFTSRLDEIINEIEGTLTEPISKSEDG